MSREGETSSGCFPACPVPQLLPAPCRGGAPAPRWGTQQPKGGTTLCRSPWGSAGTAKRGRRARGVPGLLRAIPPPVFKSAFFFFLRGAGMLLQDYLQGKQTFWACFWMDRRHKACPEPPGLYR